MDCSGHARAVAEAEERLEHVTRWLRRAEEEASAFRAAAGRFRGLLESNAGKRKRLARRAIRQPPAFGT